MVGFLFVVAAVAAIAYRAMTAEERARFAGRTRQVILQTYDAVTLRDSQLQSFRDTLCARTPFAPVAPLLVVVNIAVFMLMLWDADPMSDPDTLIAWGGSFGPRTTNGEWWRVITALFVHTSWLHLLATIAGLQLGLVLERIVGPVAFAAVYLAVGVFTSVLNVSASSVTVTAGASGAIFGTYGLMLATLMWTVFRGSPTLVSLTAAKWMAPAAIVFVAYNVATDTVVTMAETAGFLAGCACGLMFGWNASEEKTSVRRLANGVAVVLVAAVIVAVPLGGITQVIDVRPELARVVTSEEHSATKFRTASEQFQTGRMSAERLADVIERDIMPEVQATRTRFEGLEHIAAEQQALFMRCKEYLRLRDESWRVRAAALRQASMARLREADTIERTSLQILDDIAAANRG
jgi:membrane associated rhomboid family serine protease